MEDVWKIRLRKQMSVAQLSSRAGIPARRLREYEAGERPISMGDIERLARALFVDVTEIEPISSPIPASHQERPAAPRGEGPRRPRTEARSGYGGRSSFGGRSDRGERSDRGGGRGAPRGSRAPARARQSQIDHLLTLAKLFEWDQERLEKEIGQPLSQLQRTDASQWLKTLQDRVVAERPKRVRKRRPYLPESVDAFELRYLTEKQETETPITFVLFDGTEITGPLVGFGPYNITVSADKEMTLNKLAIAYYYPVAEDEGESS